MSRKSTKTPKSISSSQKVTQGNDLARSAQSLNLNEKRLILYVISKIKHREGELLHHRFYHQDLVTIFGHKRNDIYQCANEVVSKLLERIVHIETPLGWRKFQWASLAEYVHDKEKGETYIEVKLHKELEPYLLDLSERFNSVPLEEFLRIPSFNSLRLFEILWHDTHGGSNGITDYEIDDIKTRLGLRDVNGKWEKYSSFNDFSKFLQRTVEGINEHTSLDVHYKALRRGRRFSRIRFIVHRKSEAEEVQLETYEILDTMIVKRRKKLENSLEQSGFRQNPSETIDKYGLDLVERVLRKAKETERQAAKTNRPIRNIGGLIAWMLRSGTVEGDMMASNGLGGELSHEQVQAYAASLRDSYSSARTEFLQDYWRKLEPSQQDDIIDIMKAVLDRHTLKLLNKADWQGLVFEAAKHRVMVEQKLVILPKKLSALRMFLKDSDIDLDDDNRARVISAALQLEEAA